METTTYNIRAYMAGELLNIQFPSTYEVLDDAILSVIQKSPMYTKDIMKIIGQELAGISKNEVNSRLYTLLSKKIVKRSTSSDSKAPKWSLS
jgi:hypothetical protein